MGWKEVKKKYEKEAKKGGIDQNTAAMLARRILLGMGLKSPDIYRVARSIGISIADDSSTLDTAIQILRAVPSGVPFIRTCRILPVKLNAAGSPDKAVVADVLEQITMPAQPPTLLIGAVREARAAYAFCPLPLYSGQAWVGLPTWLRPPVAVTDASPSGGAWLVKQELSLLISQLEPFDLPGVTCEP